MHSLLFFFKVVGLFLFDSAMDHMLRGEIAGSFSHLLVDTPVLIISRDLMSGGRFIFFPVLLIWNSVSYATVTGNSKAKR